MAFPNSNFNVDIQNISALSCGSPHPYSCFHNRVNGVKSSKTVRDMNVCEDVMKDFFSIVTSEPIQAILPRQSVHMPVPSKCLGCASVSTSSVDNNASISLSRTSACLDRSHQFLILRNNIICSVVLTVGFHFKCVDSTGIFYIFTFFFNVFSGI